MRQADRDSQHYPRARPMSKRWADGREASREQRGNEHDKQRERGRPWRECSAHECGEHTRAEPEHHDNAASLRTKRATRRTGRVFSYKHAPVQMGHRHSAEMRAQQINELLAASSAPSAERCLVNGILSHGVRQYSAIISSAVERRCSSALEESSLGCDPRSINRPPPPTREPEDPGDVRAECEGEARSPIRATLLRAIRRSREGR